MNKLLCSICRRLLDDFVKDDCVVVGTGDGSLRKGGSFAHGMCYDNAHKLFVENKPLYHDTENDSRR